MVFVYEALKERPVGLWKTDSASPYQDYSGYGNSATASGGTPTFHASFVSGNSKCSIIGGAITIQFPSKVFKSGKESEAFTLESWVYPIYNAATSTIQILGNNGQADGLNINGTVVSFTTKYTDSSTSTAYYDVQIVKALHVVGVHTSNKNSLYINGQLVNESDISQAQQLLSYASTNSNLYSGTTSSSNLIAIDGVALYSYALSSSDILNHYLAGTNTPNAFEIPHSFGGEEIQTSLTVANKYYDHTWTTSDDWNLGTLFNVSITSDLLRPQFNIDTSMAGFWMGSVALDALPTTIDGVYVNWDGSGVTIQASLDGTTWETAQRGKYLNLITTGFTATNQVLLLKASFAGGTVLDQSYLDNLNVVVIKSNTTSPVSGHVLTFNNTWQKRDFKPIEMNQNWGAQINTGGSIVIGPDTATPVDTVFAIQMWIKNTGTSTYPSFSAVTSLGTPSYTIYRDGAVSNMNIPYGTWSLVHIVSSVAIDGAITINGPAQVGHVSLYSATLTASDVSSIYATYVGTSAVQAIDVNDIIVQESIKTPRLYDSDWSILSSG